MAEVIPFPLIRRRKLIAQLRGAKSEKQQWFTLERTAAAMQRVGIPMQVIDSQIRAVSLAAVHQEWRLQTPGGAA